MTDNKIVEALLDEAKILTMAVERSLPSIFASALLKESEDILNNIEK